jgi:hypothetical protein
MDEFEKDKIERETDEIALFAISLKKKLLRSRLNPDGFSEHEVPTLVEASLIGRQEE